MSYNPIMSMDDLREVELFTDGACSGNPGPGGWACLIRFKDTGEEQELSGGESRTTNNRMEMLAAINGLESLADPHAVCVYSDSQYVVKGISEWMAGWKKKGWKRGKNQPVMNLELWQMLDRLKDFHQITPIWVRGHNNHAENERVDQLAVAAAAKAGGSGRGR